MSRCRLCGDPANGPYCHTHQWAAGPERDLEEPPLPPNAVVVTDLHDYWMQRYRPAEVLELAAYVDEAG